MNAKTLIISILLTVFMVGCSGMSTREQRVLSGGAIGAGSGAVLGAVVGGLSVAEGALIGTGVGVLGGLIMNAVGDRGTSSSRSSSVHSSSYAGYDPAVADLQRALKSRGYDCGAVDGIMGSRTREAVMRFQSDQGLSVDGIAGPATRAKLSPRKTSS
jgi:peptidoglycan hydrolase-like protein with peptidoglycan-binding domain